MNRNLPLFPGEASAVSLFANISVTVLQISARKEAGAKKVDRPKARAKIAIWKRLTTITPMRFARIVPDPSRVLAPLASPI
ncbi:MAG: hypothetical protein EA369_06430 [Bradymonadales bacterium]|nr:MAG: hypothetical protein EA369_06430 [Bradymonadales bacterium]